MSEFQTQVESERPYLVRFATLQLRDHDAVEDVVQETLLAICRGCRAIGERLQFLRSAMRKITTRGEPD